MGLDAVELVMEIEEAFDISIPEDRASRMLTVGDVYEFIIEKTADSSLKSDTCLTAAVFYDLRRHLRSLGLSTNEIRPKSNLQNVLPEVRRRATWQTLSTRMDLEFPRLQRPPWLSILNCMIVAIIVFGCFRAFGRSNVLLAIVTAIVGGIASTTFLVLLTRPFAIYPSSTCLTIRDLVTNLVSLN